MTCASFCPGYTQVSLLAIPTIVLGTCFAVHLKVGIHSKILIHFEFQYLRLKLSSGLWLELTRVEWDPLGTYALGDPQLLLLIKA